MVKAWRELVTIPTYEIGKAEKNPIFLENRVYQGSSGVVYPYPVVESIADEPTPHEWLAVWLENEYLKVMVLPELGGRIQMAYDKIKGRHFVYYNHVIKPALVGLTGPWISGGIEFNWPQHHRPSTYLPVDYDIEESEDGSVTVWVNEMERMFHQKGMAGFTLHPGCAYLEIKGRVSNRTPLPQTFLWWANPAVEVNDQYQSVFPPDVNAVFDHGKRAVSSFPIATGTYYKMDYSAGVDISNYKNIKVPTSYMAVNSKYDFEGGYENDTHGGMLHVASHHFSPGKKQWTWGNGDFGRAWDRNLTDPDDNGVFRPYIELMAGIYTENQPDFTWLMPYEEKQFTQYFMPYRELGIVKQATKDLVMNLQPPPDPSRTGGEMVTLQLLATKRQEWHIVLRNDDGTVYYDEVKTLTPEEVLTETIDVKGAKINELTFEARKTNHLPSRSGEGGGGLTWHAEPDEIRPIPDSAEAALPPVECKTCDQLFLTGLHLEQYRHATWSALDYYEEALRRDPNDVRCLNQTGLWYLRRGRFGKAEEYLRRAVKIWQKRNPNPYDGEPIFNLALCLKYNSKTHQLTNSQTLIEAYNWFWKSTWNKAWADAGFFEAACISLSEMRLDDALDELNRCLISNSHNHKARALKASVLRLLNRKEEALVWIQDSIAIDRFNYGCLFEKWLITKDDEVLKRITTLMHGNVYNYHELALDYANAGLFHEAEQVLTSVATTNPLTLYYLGYFRYQCDPDAAPALFREAEQADPYCCFPNRLEDILVLRCAEFCLAEGGKTGAPKACYYLGCLYYDKRQYDLAVCYWERSAQLDPTFPTVWRNLALARFNKQLPADSNRQEAIAFMERAFQLDDTDARILMELDQLYKRLQRPHQFRLDNLNRHPQLIAQRDDLLLEHITLLNQLGRHEEAMQELDAHQFHPWEGGEGKVPAQYQIARVEIAKSHLAPLTSHLEETLQLLQQCLVYPPHLGEGKLYGAQENDIHYLLGLAHEALGNTDQAQQCWEEATKGPHEPAAAIYYNDAKPDKIFYQGMALRRLGRDAEANSRFYQLVNYGQQHFFDQPTMDYFAVSLPDLLVWDDSLQTKNRVHCLYMLALGHYGLGHTEKAMDFLDQLQTLDINHQGAQALRTLAGR